MTDVFAKYGEGGGDNKAVEFLQTQVGAYSGLHSQTFLLSLLDFVLLHNFFFFTLQLPCSLSFPSSPTRCSFNGKGQL